jgi:hypothetical protein
LHHILHLAACFEFSTLLILLVGLALCTSVINWSDILNFEFLGPPSFLDLAGVGAYQTSDVLHKLWEKRHVYNNKLQM